MRNLFTNYGKFNSLIMKNIYPNSWKRLYPLRGFGESASRRNFSKFDSKWFKIRSIRRNQLSIFCDILIIILWNFCPKGTPISAPWKGRRTQPRATPWEYSGHLPFPRPERAKAFKINSFAPSLTLPCERESIGTRNKC